MVKTVQTVSLLRVIAGVAIVSVLLWSVGFPTFFRSVEAAALTNASDTLSDSDLGVVSNHTFQFTIPNGVVSGQTIELSFPGSDFTFPGTGFGPDDMDVVDDGVQKTLGTSASGDIWGVATTSNTIIFTTSTSSAAVTVSSSSAITIRIGTHATSGSTGDQQIINPGGANSYEIGIGGSMVDSGNVMVTIVDDVVVTANVNTNFTFAVTAVNSNSSVNGTTTTGTSTPTSVPFGTTTANVISTIAQDLTVTTNAANGFAVTVFQSTDLQSSTGADIDGFQDGSYTDTALPWAPPSAGSTENTWGHWGFTSTDQDIFGSNLWKAASSTPRQVFSHNDPVNASTTRVGYQLQISSLQEAGDDYTTSLTYIATPVF